DQADADRAGAGDDDSAVGAPMSAETSSQAVADEADGCKRMDNLLQRRFGAPASEAGQADPRVHPGKVLARQPGLLGCSLAGTHDRAPGDVGPKPGRCRPRAALAEHGTVFILDTRPATGAAAVDPEV